MIIWYVISSLMLKIVYYCRVNCNVLIWKYVVCSQYVIGFKPISHQHIWQHLIVCDAHKYSKRNDDSILAKTIILFIYERFSDSHRRRHHWEVKLFPDYLVLLKLRLLFGKILFNYVVVSSILDAIFSVW